jgi:hypothetical protein
MFIRILPGKIVVVLAEGGDVVQIESDSWIAPRFEVGTVQSAMVF